MKSYVVELQREPVSVWIARWQQVKRDGAVTGELAKAKRFHLKIEAEVALAEVRELSACPLARIYQINEEPPGEPGVKNPAPRYPRGPLQGAAVLNTST